MQEWYPVEKNWTKIISTRSEMCDKTLIFNFRVAFLVIGISKESERCADTPCFSKIDASFCLVRLCRISMGFESCVCILFHHTIHIVLWGRSATFSNLPPTGEKSLCSIDFIDV